MLNCWQIQLTVVLLSRYTLAALNIYSLFSTYFAGFFLQLVDLKAELYRKQEQFKQEKLGQESAGAGFTSKSKVKVEYVLFWDLFSPACMITD